VSLDEEEVLGQQKFDETADLDDPRGRHSRGIATTRPVMGVFFGTSSLTKSSSKSAFWYRVLNRLSLSTQGVIELWLHSKRRAQVNQLGVVV